ncbi:MAG: cyclodeaminase/cyclohydrolase family protein, partial [Spirochaetota bacterium]
MDDKTAPGLGRLTVEEFVSRLASEEPAPGGGSAAALCGALASALARMVVSLTLGKKKYRDAWETLEPLKEESERLTTRLLELMEEDTAAYLKVSQTLKLSKTANEEKAKKQRAIQAALKEATRVPLSTLQTLATVMGMADKVTRLGNRNACSDAGAAVQLVRAAAIIAAYNIRINLSGITDKGFVARCRREEENALQ